MIRLTESEARALPGELRKLARFIAIARRLRFKVYDRCTRRRLERMWWKFHEV